MANVLTKKRADVTITKENIGWVLGIVVVAYILFAFFGILAGVVFLAFSIKFYRKKHTPPRPDLKA